MRILIALLFASAAYGQQVPNNVYGTWISYDFQDQLQIYENNNDTLFIRSNNGEVLAQGSITSDGQNFVITRSDIYDNYTLGTFVGHETMVISKPESTEAWLWVKVSGY
jgi:hypothetical protein